MSFPTILFYYFEKCYYRVHNYASSQTKVKIGIWSIGYRKANKVYRHCIENSASVWIFGSLLTKFPIEILVWQDA